MRTGYSRAGLQPSRTRPAARNGSPASVIVRRCTEREIVHLVKQIRLNLIFHTSGRHDAGWKAFDDATTLVDDVDHQIMLANLAEEAKFDAIFLPDTHAVLGSSFLRKPRRGLDPVILLGAIARETKHLGLISTMSALTGHPYVVARAIATLQHISKGRAGWNIVTSQEDQALQALGMPIDEK